MEVREDEGSAGNPKCPDDTQEETDLRGLFQ